MGALSRELPENFQAALNLAHQLLSRNHSLVEKNVIETESEQIVIAAYRKATGQALSRMDLFMRLQDRFPEAAGETVIIYASARAEGKILQHLIGYQTFLDHEYEVGPDVLVPRPETEFLVAIALDEIGRQFPVRGQPFMGLEIGLGSGAIAIEILSRFPGARIFASELTPQAEARAKTNARRILNQSAVDSARLKVLRANDPLEVWQPFERARAEGALTEPVQFLISNPPYLANEQEVEAEVLNQEPKTALFGPAHDPAHFYREIAKGARNFLEPGAPVYLEIPHERAALIEGIFTIEGWKTRIAKDLSGRDRVLSARFP
ncbi:MAG: N5-glutamine methyltransferase family protein [Bdellovibrionia bacterium]